MRYPSEDAQLPAVDKSFTFGETLPGSRVSVNGVPALVAADGGWIAYVPFSAGRFVLHVRAVRGSASSEVDRSITVAAASPAAFPEAITVVQPGEAVNLSVDAPRESQVVASGPGFSDVALAPAPSLGPETFSATVQLPKAANGRVTYRITGSDGATSVVTSDGHLEAAPSPVLFVGTVVPYAPDPLSGPRPYGMLCDKPDGETSFTAPVGTPYAVTGRYGRLLRVALGTKQSAAWIDEHELAPQRTPLPFGRITSDAVRTDSRETIYTERLTARAPIRIDEDPSAAQLDLHAFGAGAGGADAILVMHPRQRTLWGYRVRWIGNDLEIAVKKPPAMAASPRPALAALLVVIDPGHAPDPGAVGPVGTIERDVNLDISLRLAAKLRELGARVVLTRQDDSAVTLYARPQLAERLDADVLVSVHNNALPDGVDPASRHGYSVFYFQPHSRALAEAMHAAYAADTSLRDDGLYVGDLALVRTPELPAVLTESAYVMWPPEEMQLRDPAFRDRLAATMRDGLERWAEAMRRIEDSAAGGS